MVKGLGESMRGQWSGDADLNDGCLNTLYQEYKQRLKFAAEIGIGDHGTPQVLEHDLQATFQELAQDLAFLHLGKLS